MGGLLKVKIELSGFRGRFRESRPAHAIDRITDGAVFWGYRLVKDRCVHPHPSLINLGHPAPTAPSVCRPHRRELSARKDRVGIQCVLGFGVIRMIHENDSFRVGPSGHDGLAAGHHCRP